MVHAQFRTDALLRRAVVPIAGIAALASPVAAQQSRYLMPHAFTVAPGAAVSLEVRGPSPGAWPGADMRHFFVLSPGAKSNRENLPVPEEGNPSWTLQHQGVSVIGFDLLERTIETTPAELSSFLDQHAPASLTQRPAAEGPIGVKQIEVFRTLVRAGGVPGASSVATDKTSQPAEIRPIFDPTAVEPGSTLAFRTYARGESVKGARVIATHLDSGRRVEVETDRSAIGNVVLAWPGAWLLEFHHVQPPKDEEPWSILSFTMTFEISEEADR